MHIYHLDSLIFACVYLLVSLSQFWAAHNASRSRPYSRRAWWFVMLGAMCLTFTVSSAARAFDYPDQFPRHAVALQAFALGMAVATVIAILSSAWPSVARRFSPHTSSSASDSEPAEPHDEMGQAA